MRLYLDNCCFNRPFDDQSQLRIKLETDAKLFIQHKIFTGEYELVWSYILEFENNRNPYEDKKSTIADWKKTAIIKCTEIDGIVEYAESLSELGIKPKDALHIACAVFAECDYFVTTDKKLLSKSIEGVRIVSPLTFLNELEV